MAYVPPYTPSGTVTALGLNNNLKTLQDYVNGGVAAGDLKTSAAWVDKTQVMPGRYYAHSNTMSFVSGFCGGRTRTVPTDLYTYLNRQNTARLGAIGENKPYSFVPNGSVMLELPRAASVVFVSWFGYHKHNGYDSDNRPGAAEVELVLTQDSLGDQYFFSNDTITAGTATSSGRLPHSISWTVEESAAVAGGGTTEDDYAPGSGIVLRAPNAGFIMINPGSGVSAGLWRAALIGQTNSPTVRWLHWSINIEAWY
jgi:hypothetical protein